MEMWSTQPRRLLGAQCAALRSLGEGGLLGKRVQRLSPERSGG